MSIPKLKDLIEFNREKPKKIGGVVVKSEN